MANQKNHAVTAFVIYILLLVLLLATWGISYVSLGPWNAVVALGIAAAKAALIALFFMELRGSRPVTWLAAAVGFVWLGIMLVLSAGDFWTRGYLNIPGK